MYRPDGGRTASSGIPCATTARSTRGARRFRGGCTERSACLRARRDCSTVEGAIGGCARLSRCAVATALMSPRRRAPGGDSLGSSGARRPGAVQGINQRMQCVLRARGKAFIKAVAATGERGLMELVMATHAGTTTEEFAASVRQWVNTARHPTLKRPYTELVYQPMLELLAYLRANGFKTYIVSGGGIEFMRVFAEEVYGVPPEQVIGSTIATRYELRDGTPVIVREPNLDFIDDKAGKPLAINKFIGRRPVMAFGNSDGDFEMLEWTTAGTGPRLAAIVHHDDAAREFAYDRDSHIGRLRRGLDEGPKRGWLILSMKDDWKAVYPVPAR
ncbi:MAG: HAD family hydrolase [bacterium]